MQRCRWNISFSRLGHSQSIFWKRSYWNQCSRYDECHGSRSQSQVSPFNIHIIDDTSILNALDWGWSTHPLLV